MFKNVLKVNEEFQTTCKESFKLLRRLHVFKKKHKLYFIKGYWEIAHDWRTNEWRDGQTLFFHGLIWKSVTWNIFFGLYI